MSRLCAALITAPLLLGCSERSTTDPAGLVPPTARASRSFGDPGLSGGLILSIASPGVRWRYEVDLDGDGIPDATGDLEDIALVPYRFDEPGVHPILVELTAEGTTIRDTVYAIVDDSDAFEILQELDLGEDYEAIAYGADGLFTTDRGSIRRHSEITLQVVDAVHFEPVRHGSRDFQGIEFSPEGRLYTIDDNEGQVAEVDPSTLALERFIATTPRGNYLVYLSRQGRLYTGGPFGMSVVDLETETILRDKPDPELYFFDVLRERGAVAAGYFRGGRGVELLDGETLEPIWSSPWPDVQVRVVAVSADERTIYALGSDSPEDIGDRWLFFRAIAAEDGAVIRELILEPCRSCFFDVRSHSSAHVAGGTLVMAVPNGAYYVDPVLHLPIFRIPLVYNVTGAAAENEAYFGCPCGWIWHVRIQP